MSLNEPFKFRYVREIVGVFVLGSLAVALVGLLALGTGRRWFERKADLGAVFDADRAAVIHKGVPVRLAGERVGEVTAIRLEGTERSHVTMRVRARATEALRTDSTAILRVPIAGLVGELAVELTPGTEGEPWPLERELPGIAQGELLGELEHVAAVLAAEVPVITKQVRMLLENANSLAGQAAAGRAGTHASALLASTSRLVDQLERERVAAIVARLERRRTTAARPNHAAPNASRPPCRARACSAHSRARSMPTATSSAGRRRARPRSRSRRRSSCCGPRNRPRRRCSSRSSSP